MLLLPLIAICLGWYKLVSMVYCFYLIYFSKTNDIEISSTLSLFLVSWLSEYIFESYIVRIIVWSIVLTPTYRLAIFHTIKNITDKHQEQINIRVGKIKEDLESDIEHLSSIWNPNTPTTIIMMLKGYFNKLVKKKPT